MAMKTSVGRLYMLFNACLPDNEQVQKRLNICKILESQEYTALKSYDPFKQYFDTYFSKDKLSEYDVDKLNEMTKVLSKIIPTIEKIANAINYGNATELTKDDRPDFSSIKSLDALFGKLKIDQANQNITNITKNKFMDIFSTKTLKDPTDALKSLNVDDIKNPVEAVRRNLAQNVYCFKSKDIANIQDKYAEKVSIIKDKLDALKEIKRSLRMKKLIFIGLSIILLVAINSFELLSSDGLAILTSLSTILIMLYFFIG